MKVRIEVGGRMMLSARLPESIVPAWLEEAREGLVGRLTFWAIGGLQQVLVVGEPVELEEVARRLGVAYGEVDTAILQEAMLRLERSAILGREGDRWVRLE